MPIKELLILLTILPALPAAIAQASASAPQADIVANSVELSAGAQSLSNGYGHWRDLTLKGSHALPGQVLQGELSLNKRYGKDGAFLGLSDTYTFNDDWHGSVALGLGDGAFYLPRYRLDATLYRKFLPNRALVGSIGTGYYAAPDGHTDRSVSLGAAYYFETPWILEGGVRLNRSNPGAVDTHQQFLALTWGRDKQDLVTGRYGWGREGYLALTANTQLVDFSSHEASLTWRHWLNARTGVLVGVNSYSNPLYRRTGLNAGVFHAF